MLRRRLFALQRLLDLKTLEFRMSEIERGRAAAVAGTRMRPAELLGRGPGFERRLALPDGVRGIQRMVFGFWTFEQVEFDKTRHLVQIAVAALPDAFERFFRAFDHLEAVHGDEHRLSPCVNDS